jgi:hypothetical protein
MPVLPPKRNPVLLVHSDAVAAGLVTPQQLQTIASRNRQIIKPTRRVDQSELSLYAAPKLSWNPPSAARVSLAEQIG